MKSLRKRIGFILKSASEWVRFQYGELSKFAVVFVALGQVVVVLDNNGELSCNNSIQDGELNNLAVVFVALGQVK